MSSSQPPATVDETQSFLGRDPRHPWRLAVALVAIIATFPVIWAVLIFFYALGQPGANHMTQHGERVIIVLAGIVPPMGVVGVSLEWFNARRRYPKGERGMLL